MSGVGRRRPLRVALAVAALGASVAAAGGSARASTPAAGGSTVWLCRPGLANDPCSANLDATVVSAAGARAPQPAQPATDAPVDCFYVYPTVSAQPTSNANLIVQPAETAAAVEQASRFSQVCRVWAPMYRQRTATSLRRGLGADPQADAVAYASLLQGWRDYLAHDNRDRPIVFIGHSQGAAMLIRLLRSQVDPNPTLRKRLISAILLGGNVVEPNHTSTAGTFAHIPECTSAQETGCVIAYSSFLEPPPADSLFGRPGQGVSAQSLQYVRRGVHVVCVNPAALHGGSGLLEPYFFVAPTNRARTPWVTFPDLYRGTCVTRGGATWLQVRDVGTSGDRRPTVTQAQGAQWGLHAVDVNLALGNLVTDARTEIASFEAHQRTT